MKIKKLVPLSIRVFLKINIIALWQRRHYDSWPFGAWWSIWNRSYKTEGMRFELPFAMMPFGFRSRFLFDTYEIGERRLAKKYLERDDSILELGGCLGIVSCVCNSQLSNRTCHVVVEANPQLIPWIEKNKILNGAQFRIEHGMLSRSSEVDFFLQQFIVSGSAHLEGGQKVKVPVFSIDDICQKYGFIPSTLVMDIEGGEIDFLEENIEWLKAKKEFTKIIVEVHPFIVGNQAVDKFHSRLRDLGFVCQETQGTVEVWTRK